MVQQSLSPISRKLASVLKVTLGLYAVALLTSMGGMEIFGWTSAALVLVMLAFDGRNALDFVRGALYPFDWALFGLFVVIVFGALFIIPDSVDPVFVIGNSRWILLFVILRVGLAQVWSGTGSRKVILGLSALLAVVCLYGIWQYFEGRDLIRGARHVIPVFGYSGDRPFYRAEGLFGTPMTFGNSLVLSVCFPAALFLRRVETGWSHRFLGIVTLISLVALMATLTRGVWIAAFFALAYIAVNSGKYGIKVFLALLVGFFLASQFAFPEMASRVQSVTDKGNSSNNIRLTLWKTNLEMVKDHPILGVGYGVNEDIIGTYYEKLGIVDGFSGHAHNTLLQFLAGTGVIGLTFYLVFAISCLWMNWKLRSMVERPWERALVDATLGAQIALHLGGLTECNFKDAEVNHQFMFILAIMCTLYMRSRAHATKRVTEPSIEQSVASAAI